MFVLNSYSIVFIIKILTINVKITTSKLYLNILLKMFTKNVFYIFRPIKFNE